MYRSMSHDDFLDHFGGPSFHDFRDDFGDPHPEPEYPDLSCYDDNEVWSG